MTATATTAWRGKTIEFEGKRYLVRKVNPKNLRVVDAAGKSYNLTRHASFTVVSDPALQVRPVAPVPAASPSPAQARHVGDLVRITSGKFADTRAYVVTRYQRQTDRWDVYLVNGKSSRYYRLSAECLSDYAPAGE